MSLSIQEIERQCLVSQRRAHERRARATRRRRVQRAAVLVIQLAFLLGTVVLVGYLAGQLLS